MKKHIFLILTLCVFIPRIIEAQIDTTHTIFSKMDIAPQHTLWDGNQTMLMGYTSLMGGVIDILGSL